MFYHYFDPNLAIKYGIDHAVILSYFWENVKRSTANKSNLHDGLSWSKDSKPALLQLFPYINDDRLEFILRKLQENDLIFYKYSEKVPTEIWYTLTKQSLEYFTKGTAIKTTVRAKKVINQQTFADIKSFDSASIKEDRIYLILAYKFWKIWITDNPKSFTLQNAKISKWIDGLKYIVERDKQDFKRLVGVYVYFERCAANEAGYDRFWFETIKSINALRKKDKDDVYYLDRIIDKVNKKIDLSDDFYKAIIAEEKKIISKTNKI